MPTLGIRSRVHHCHSAFVRRGADPWDASRRSALAADATSRVASLQSSGAPAVDSARAIVDRLRGSQHPRGAAQGVTEVEETQQLPTLSPVDGRRRGPSGYAAAVLGALVMLLVGISLGSGSRDENGSREARGARAATTAVPTQSPDRNAGSSIAGAGAGATSIGSAPSAATMPDTTASPDPRRGLRPPRVDIPMGVVPACPSGSTPDTPGNPSQSRPPTDVISMTFDRGVGRIVLVAQHGDPRSTETWTFDVCANAWTQMHPRSAPETSPFALLVYDTATRQDILVSGSNVWSYDLRSDTWTFRGHDPSDGSPVRVVYDPVEEQVVSLRLTRPSVLSGFDAATGTWQRLLQDHLVEPPYSFDTLLAYDASVDRLVSFHLSEVRLFDLRTGTWSGPGTPHYLPYGGYLSLGGEIAYDEGAARTILFSGGLVIAYDAAEDSWETLFSTPSQAAQGGEWLRPYSRMEHHMVYDPINERIVVYGGVVPITYDPWWVSTDDVPAFDVRTRAWTQLLAPSRPIGSEVAPAPGT
jgi:hypothetical protein